MIIIPLYLNYMNKFINVSTRIVSPEEEKERLARRNKITILLKEYTNLTTKEIANAIGEDIRNTNGLLIALQKQNKINSTLTDQGRIWRLV